MGRVRSTWRQAAVIATHTHVVRSQFRFIRIGIVHVEIDPIAPAERERPARRPSASTCVKRSTVPMVLFDAEPPCVRRGVEGLNGVKPFIRRSRGPLLVGRVRRHCRQRLDENGDRRREGGSGHVPSSSTIPASGTTPVDLHGGPRSTGGVQSHHQRAHCRRTTWSAAVWDRCVVENHVGFSSASQEQARS
jgi:hypothetical protein